MMYGSENFYCPLPVGYESEAWKQYWEDERQALEQEQEEPLAYEIEDGIIVDVTGKDTRMKNHFFYFPTREQAQNFVDGSEVLAGTAQFVAIYPSTRDTDKFYALYKSEQEISIQDARVIIEESELYGSSRAYVNE